MKKLSENVHQKLMPDHVLILVNNPSKPIFCMQQNFNIWNCTSLITNTSNNFLYLITKSTRLESRAFLKRFRTFSEHVGHFCNIALLQHNLVLRWDIFPSTTSSLLSDEERGEV